jgi:valyl-tRNA synthetase
MVDFEAEKQRLVKEIDGVRNEADRLEGRLKDKDFLAKAPAAVVEKEQARLATITDRLKRLEHQLTQT